MATLKRFRRQDVYKLETKRGQTQVKESREKAEVLRSGSMEVDGRRAYWEVRRIDGYSATLWMRTGNGRWRCVEGPVNTDIGWGTIRRYAREYLTHWAGR